MTRLVMAVRDAPDGTESELVEVTPADGGVCLSLDDGTRLIFDAAELSAALQEEAA